MWELVHWTAEPGIANIVVQNCIVVRTSIVVRKKLTYWTNAIRETQLVCDYSTCKVNNLWDWHLYTKIWRTEYHTVKVTRSPCSLVSAVVKTISSTNTHKFLSLWKRLTQMKGINWIILQIHYCVIWRVLLTCRVVQRGRQESLTWRLRAVRPAAWTADAS